MYDAVVIGAGVAGLYQLVKLRGLGLSTLVVEAGSDVGGTWYWNRYPGARFDSESYTYSYSFDADLLDEWEWSEHFSAQPETLRYLQHVADRFDLRSDIRFDTTVASARWDEARSCWVVAAVDGERWTARFLITAIGVLSAPTLPDIPGVETFAGESFHTARWPQRPVDLAGRRVGVIGTGATGVQVIQEVAKVAGSLTVFQRTPNWCAPLHNAPISPEEQRRIKEEQHDILRRCNDSFGGFIHDTVREKATEVSPAERMAFWEQRYREPGFGIWFANYRDVLVDPVANEMMSEFMASKIAERVDDPATAKKLTPTDHGFGTRRVPMETGYYEVYNQANVALVDVCETPIERITATGVRTEAADYSLDVLIYATGFDAVTGAFDRIDITGVEGRTLRDAWTPAPSTYLGLQTPGFPNLFTLVGPHNVATFCNMTRCIEQNVDWVTDCLGHLGERSAVRIEAEPAAADDWTAHVRESADRLLLSRVDSWFTGVNRNVSTRSRSPLIYAGGLPQYRDRCDEVAAAGYVGFVIS